MDILKHLSKLAGLAVVIVLVLNAGVSASTIANLTSTLIGPGNVGQLTVEAQVDQASNIYTYIYNVTYDQGTADVHIYGVANDNDSAYFGAQNTAASGTQFNNPTYVYVPGQPPANIEWNSGLLQKPNGSTKYSRTFSYQSYYAPQDILVYAYAVDGGAYAEGVTLGMGTTIPEPASLIALGLGLLGLAPRLFKRK